jgi:tetratricopeptide (TPR) repeat protein
VFFQQAEVNSLVEAVSPKQRDRDIEERLTELAPRIVAARRDHRHFGPFWWWIKPLLRRMPGTRGSWVRRGYIDRAADRWGRELPIHVPGGADERSRWIAWLGLRYYDNEIVDDLPAEFHIIQPADRSVCEYRPYDADASRQLDLFAEPPEPSPELAGLMRDPARFSGSAWLRRADEYEAAGEPWPAAAALRRAIDRAVDDSDRSRAWLRLGQLFQERDHVHKAIFCYRNAFEREHEGWVQGLMGAAWLQAGDPAEALTCYRRALQAMPHNPEYLAGRRRAEREIVERGRIGAAYPPAQDRVAR